MDTNRILGIHAGALSLHSQRLELIAGNIANVETPGFKAKTVDFSEAMRQLEAQVQSGPKAGVNNPPLADALSDLQPILRTQVQPTLDGNTVDIGREQADYAEAALRYRATLGFVESRLRGILTAVTGE